MTQDAGAAVTAAFHAERGRVISVLIGTVGDPPVSLCAREPGPVPAGR
jgi:hypothetical protein